MTFSVEMPEQELIDAPEPVQAEQRSVPDSRVTLRPGLALLSIAALVCSSLEIEFLEQLDGLSLYMTFREIVWDGAVALLVLLGITVLWWLCIVVIVGISDLIPWARPYRKSVLWHFGLAVPLWYFALDLFDAIRLGVYPHWHPGLRGWLWLSAALIVICVAALWTVSVAALQNFCRTRLAPLGWFHVALACIAAIALWARGTHLFHDYVHPGKTATAVHLPDIYLITVDALRAEDMSVYGYNRLTTPNLERFARQAFTFDSFFANSNFTTPSTVSIETGKLPWTHRVFQLGGFLRGQAQQENLAELLRQQGYYTADISANSLASPMRHRTLASYDAVEYVLPVNGSRAWLRYSNLVGFNTLVTLSGPLLRTFAGIGSCLDTLIWGDHYPYPPEAVFERARTLLERDDVTRPRFLWTHILPPHDPYLAAPPFRMRFLHSTQLTRIYDFNGMGNHEPPPGSSVADLQARYDESVAYADQAVGDFLDWLDRTGRLDQSLVIVTADHGESFEHGWLMHTGPHLYAPLIHIPMLIHVPGQTHGARISESAEQVDVLPTILDLIGRQAPDWAEGTSLKPALEAKSLPKRFIFSMNFEREKTFEPITNGTVAVIDNEFKYEHRLNSAQDSLYRYTIDPLEDHDLIESEPGVAKRMREMVLNKLKEINERTFPNREDTVPQQHP